ncbi:RHS repeat domain-containing protein [Pseudoxanthomonas sp. 22568]|uniref:RHS repeat domain-containing protein n=1 Tax=Pseudoxanthomonas sp. 22568 TaxID=3453945 RepID=UPI00296EE75E|nr:RHS repeat protein [Pseudoxanthomonas japonensis]
MKRAVLGMLLALPLAGEAQTYSKTETIEYYDDPALWVMGQVKRTTTNGVETSSTVYGWKALPTQTSEFGRVPQVFTYDVASPVDTGQLGTLRTVRDGNNNVTTFNNWKRGIPQTITYADSTTQSAVVNGNGWIDSVTDEGGYTTCYTYDAMGRLASITHPSETTAGVCNTSAWARTTQSFAPSAVGRYGLPAGYWIQIVDTGAARRVKHFDALWRPVLEEQFDNTNGTTIAATHSLVVKRYDTEGQLEFQSYPVSSLTSINDSALKGIWSFYDALGRVTSVSQDSESGPLTTLTAYEAGFKTKVTSPKGQVSITSYQAYDQPSYDWPMRIEQQPLGAITDITRDAWGKPTRITRRGGVGEPVLERSYVYDERQRLCKMVEPETGTTVMGYDAAGLLIGSASGLTLSSLAECSTALAAASGRWVLRSYDTRQRLNSLTFPDGQGNQRWQYWPGGQVKQVSTLNDGVYTYNSYAYFRRGLPRAEALARADGATWTLGYDYDTSGNLSSVRYPSGQTVAYLPNALGQPTQTGTYAKSVSYYPNGAIKQFSYGNGIVHTLTQNARQLPEVSQDAYGGTALLRDGYSYDKNGNVTAIADGAAGRNQRGNRTMEYDGLDRLVRVESPMFGVAQYGYDVLDNLTRVVAPGRDHHYCYDPSWRLTNVKTGGCAGATVIGLGYDVQGNLSNRNGTAHIFDYGNRLREVRNAESYQYDAHGRRTRSQQAGGALFSFYDQAGVLRYQQNQRTGKATDYIQLGGSLVAEVDWPASLPVRATTYVNWSAVSGAVRYVVEESIDGMTWTAVYDGATPGWTSLDRPSGSYSYRVLSCNATGVCAAVANPGVKHQANNPMPLLYQLLLSP